MINIFKKIISTGKVTEKYDDGQVPTRFRGEVVIEDQDCIECQACTKVCPTKAIFIVNDSLHMNHNACIFCGRCVEQCEKKQIKHTDHYKLATLSGSLGDEAGHLLKKKIWSILRRSLHIRHVDVGSCNACDFEMNALSNPIYDVQQYGIDFVASPRHADLLMVTGVVTRNLTQALLMTYEAVPTPKIVIAVGACAASGQVFSQSYALRGAVDEVVPVDVYVPGCPPRPQALLYGLLLAMNKF
ncbi:NADH-quinone oxidoreductase subunit NuoB [Pelosinus sp. sgz500959]|uniref:NADH-quinone oxidoreductase subunit NuoB n=1 Tax=Pelosinus sp. sgz500959 TaxID=3242472 RepID=UPI00366D231C